MPKCAATALHDVSSVDLHLIATRDTTQLTTLDNYMVTVRRWLNSSEE